MFVYIRPEPHTRLTLLEFIAPTPRRGILTYPATFAYQ
jgi:hypothetical protein